MRIYSNTKNNNIKKKNYKFLLGIIFSKLCQSSIQFKKTVLIPNTKFSFNILKFLYVKGFITSFQSLNNNYFIVYLKYYNGISLFNSFKVLSKPNKKYYLSNYKIKTLISNNSFVIISTSKGLFSIYDCLFFNIGGEVLISFK